MSFRRIIPLLDGWQFSFSPDAGWQDVCLPHTYNALDGARGGEYFRGCATYRRRLPAGLLNAFGRKFLHFEGCALTAIVRLDSTVLAVHRGGFTGFYAELPSSIPEGAVLEVEVNNARQQDVIPLAGDFTIFGGIYRAVHAVTTAETCFLPTPCGSDGIRILNQVVSADMAKISWSAQVAVPLSKPGVVRLSVRDATGRVVVEALHESEGADGGSAEIIGEVLIPHPRLWQGVSDPHQYELTWELLCDGRVADCLVRKIGLRTLSRDERGGILLNGQKLILRGVCKHQDTAGKATAVSNEDLKRDLEIAVELGANAIRLAHYPHAQITYDLCDELGLMVWTEIPLVNELYKTAAFREVTIAQLREMIGQLAHHVSIFCWGIFNELYSSKSDRWTELVEELHLEARHLDPSRFTACAGHAETPVEIRNFTDLLATNAYPGWYHSKPEDMAARIIEWNASGRGRGLGVSEYGAGGNPWLHEEPPQGPYPTEGFWHPEEWQCYCHERQYEAIRQSPDVWGSFIWVFFDFFSDRRNEGGIPGINNKGLVTVDRVVKKDAFYFYQAHWAAAPVLHITSKRNFKPVSAPQSVRVYSNCTGLVATLDGIELSRPRLAFGVVYEFDLPTLSAGLHSIEIKGVHKEESLSDRRDFVVAR